MKRDATKRDATRHDAIQRHSLAIALALVALASLRIVLTYTVFNHTSDEPNHLACGLELLQKGTYTFETQHPPLARVAAAIGPYLIGARIRDQVQHDTMDVPVEGVRILSHNHQYDLTLALSRLGILPFFWIACAVVFWWTRRLYGAEAAVLALLLFSFLPPILAHAGLATTDMALTAFLGAAFVAGIYWSEDPTPRRAALFGGCTALAVLSKYSSLPFLPVCLLLYFLLERPKFQRRHLASLGLAVLVGAVVVWAGFLFSFGNSLPAPEFFSGLQSALQHNRLGHPTYLLGQHSETGFWYYYPVILAVKTPLAFLALFFVGLYRPKGVWQPLALIGGVLAVGFYSSINIGLRHILPIYLGMAPIAALGILRLRARVWLPAVLLLWFAASSLLAHPDYLPYFNELAAGQPEKIVVDSDLDWGQDLKRLSRRLHEVGAPSVAFHSILVASYYDEFHFPRMTPQDPFVPTPGWNAVSVTYWKLARLGLMVPTRDGKLENHSPDRTLWPDAVPPGERIGKSIILWNMVAR
ncbi:MAG TPA: glycosyltransferase family 39 protein [Candidatus Sulfopaludibacter sp.]|jgi:hypothetical protein|nr:glycosyltransferase family 39 protein [Candidatus Sulfopaludibacter sp.]